MKKHCVSLRTHAAELAVIFWIFFLLSILLFINKLHYVASWGRYFFLALPAGAILSTVLWLSLAARDRFVRSRTARNSSDGPNAP